MPQRITVTIGGLSLSAELNETSVARAVHEALPLQGRAHRWGDEYYMTIPVAGAKGAAQQTQFAVGELGYWPPGPAFCLFFGPTPASHGTEPRMASPGCSLGRLLEDVSALRSLPGTVDIRLERA
jgi:hypothetical protein